jgi:predicted phosphodiesterase
MVRGKHVPRRFNRVTSLPSRALRQKGHCVRIAVVSDIHGNLPALEAVLKDLPTVAPDDVWCGGDIAWGAPWASECIAQVREQGWTTIKGNTDIWITGDPQTVESPEDRVQLAELAQAHDISADDERWLLNLPLGHSGPGSILLVHASPESPFSAPQPEDPASHFEIYESRASLVVYGHIHRAFMRRLKEGTLVCNSGAVGLPKDGDSACYLVIDQQGSDFVMRHRRVDFDRNAAIEEAERLGGPVAELFLENMRG